MKILLDNIGLIKHAELEPGDITILCGQNNTGKTYATYVYYGFLTFITSKLFENPDEIIDFKNIDLTTLASNHTLEIPLEPYIENYASILQKICSKYSEEISDVFASDKTRFAEAKFQVELRPDEVGKLTADKTTAAFLTIVTDPEKKKLTITNKGEADKKRIPEELLKAIIVNEIVHAVFGDVFGHSIFIASVERTGASVFNQELFLNRNRILEVLSENARKNKDVDLRDVVINSFSPYPYPVKDNVSFIQELTLHKNDVSELSETHPEIIDEFSRIVGGTYTLDKDGTPLFTPNNAKSKKLQLTESSSVVRALLHLDYYLRRHAKKGDILIVDEPEINLHPENQCRITRIFARLVNAGIKVFITTHSDYIIRELNTLILLNRSTPESEKIREEYNYLTEELLDADKVRVYTSEVRSYKKSPKSIITDAPVSKEWGIAIESFDAVINKMNEIQDKLLWGE